MPFLGAAGMGGLSAFLKPRVRPSAVFGGILSEDSTYFYRTFFSNDSLTVVGGKLNADFLVLAGGGGGGSGATSANNGGGGGAGGLLTWTVSDLAPSAYSVLVGAGGGANVNGSNSSISTYSTVGGGRGAGQSPPVASLSGGSGGGGAPTTANGSNTGASGTAGQGNAGGNGNVASPYHGGGGGGAGAAGSAGSAGGHGGAGTNAYSTWHTATGTGVSGYIAGGGGGAGDSGRASGGSGGGGGGGLPSADLPSAGLPNTGSGGGGGSSQVPSISGANGGSGLVIVRYLKSEVTAPVAYDYELITTQVITSTSSNIVFTSLPTDYKHLQLRIIGSSDNVDGYIYFNGDTNGANYRRHYIYGLGSGNASAGSDAGAFTDTGALGTTNPQVQIHDILDYRSTIKNKSSRIMYGQDNNGSGRIGLNTVGWFNTSAITSITLSGRTYAIGSRFSLYGIRG